MAALDIKKKEKLKKRSAASEEDQPPIRLHRSPCVAAFICDSSRVFLLLLRISLWLFCLILVRAAAVRPSNASFAQGVFKY